MFALAVEYLTGVVYAADYRDRNRPEWPPHPGRLFSALVAACHALGLAERGAAVLRWLERQEAPALYCSTATARSAPRVFTPVNDPDNDALLLPLRLRQPRTFPCIVPVEPRVYFIWPQAEPDAEQRRLLAHLAAHVVYLGASQSLVQVGLCNAPPAPNWSPGDQGELVLRVASPGRFDELETLYRLGRRPTPGLLQPYVSVSKVSEPAMPTATGAFADFLSFRCRGGPPLRLENALLLTMAARRAVLSLAGTTAPASLHGHGPHPHCAWLPLPWVGQPQADGRLLGLAVLLPHTLAQDERQAVLRILARLHRITLPGGQVWQVEPATLDQRATLWRHTWAAAARVWSSVTPVILDRFPRPGRTGREVADIIAASCRQMGYGTPAAIALSRYSTLEGVPPSARFRVRRQVQEPQRPYTHVMLQFAESVRGPLVIGAGKYFGLGLLRPLP